MWVRGGRSIGMTSQSIRNMLYMSLYGISTIAALAHDPTAFGCTRARTLCGPSRCQHPYLSASKTQRQKVWFQRGGRGAEMRIKRSHYLLQTMTQDTCDCPTPIISRGDGIFLKIYYLELRAVDCRLVRWAWGSPGPVYRTR
jgi:hypothetical protein